jgi:DNA-binding response OmpR family regulator
MFRSKEEKNHAGTVLIVDDEPSVREVLGSLLSEEGYRTDFAENGHVGYEKARELIPDLIILDVMMPGIDGFEVCRKIRAESPLAQVPIIMITAVSDDRSRLRSIQSGADEFISKPFDFEELLTKVKKVAKNNCLRGLPPEWESREVAHEDLRDARDATVEGRESRPELRDIGTEGNSRRENGCMSILTGPSRGKIK